MNTKEDYRFEFIPSGITYLTPKEQETLSSLEIGDEITVTGALDASLDKVSFALSKRGTVFGYIPEKGTCCLRCNSLITRKGCKTHGTRYLCPQGLASLLRHLEVDKDIMGVVSGIKERTNPLDPPLPIITIIPNIPAYTLSI